MFKSSLRHSGLNLSQQGKLRKQRINSPTFNPEWMGDSGPMFIIQSCGFVNNKYRDGIKLEKGITGYDQIKWNK